MAATLAAAQDALFASDQCLTPAPVLAAVDSLADIAAVTPPEIRLFLALLLSYPVALTWRALPPGPSGLFRHVFSVVVGTWMLQFVNGYQALFNVASCLLCYALMWALGPRSARLVSFVAMAILAAGHLYRQITDYLGWTLDWTLVAMVTTQKLMGLAYNVQDGADPDATKEQKARSVEKLPSLLEFLSFILFPANVTIGPAFDHHHADRSQIYGVGLLVDTVRSRVGRIARCQVQVLLWVEDCRGLGVHVRPGVQRRGQAHGRCTVGPRRECQRVEVRDVTVVAHVVAELEQDHQPVAATLRVRPRPAVGQPVLHLPRVCLLARLLPGLLPLLPLRGGGHGGAPPGASHDPAALHACGWQDGRAAQARVRRGVRRGDEPHRQLLYHVVRDARAGLVHRGVPPVWVLRALGPPGHAGDLQLRPHQTAGPKARFEGALVGECFFLFVVHLYFLFHARQPCHRKQSIYFFFRS
ncbi:1-acyl-sn-glycerol-3-phosphate acyltransferase [Chondrus crispus]|uniref:1-acyl-sn-glycerol-3-phosphate acyltransferase n=1 Tax=Chondrus crispus TaxID=2769 RepID=R7QVE3_CHOCR|nr:1-acyl-sn-glycerol-3-phosphate acyltransferase [Chondrus crispus]CDF41421.1 1-acyl-sn-glycerol-3-phosphate acyltransferase [Chondrus crispus]|eukprot:XP_005711715.1 1-acyl-sn-glycerol-3-phosphate acyltransferase [Chondrus crispus]